MSNGDNGESLPIRGGGGGAAAGPGSPGGSSGFNYGLAPTAEEAEDAKSYDNSPAMEQQRGR